MLILLIKNLVPKKSVDVIINNYHKEGAGVVIGNEWNCLIIYNLITNPCDRIRAIISHLQIKKS